MGVEDGTSSAEPTDGEGGTDIGEGPRPVAKDAGACAVRKLVIDPTLRALIDVRASSATSLVGQVGEKVLDAGVAGISFPIDVGRRMIGTPPAQEVAEVPPQSEA